LRITKRNERQALGRALNGFLKGLRGEQVARLNIEDQFWLEVVSMIAKMGDEDRAIGNALRWFRFAQEKHKQGKLVSEEEFTNNRFHESLFPIFAKRIEGGIQCIGAEKHFGWLALRSEAGSKGGKVSAQRPRDEKGRLLPVQANSKQTPSETQQDQDSDPKDEEIDQNAEGISNLETENDETEPDLSKQTPSKSKLSQPSSSYSSSINKEKINKKETDSDEKIKFESLWQSYPKKVKKREGFKRLLDQIQDLPRIEKAMGNYIRYLDQPWVDRFPKDFDTFIGTKSNEVKFWHDWEDPDPSLYQPPKNWKAPNSTGGTTADPWLFEADLFMKAATSIRDFNKKSFVDGDPARLDGINQILLNVLGEERIPIFREIGTPRIWDTPKTDWGKQELARLIESTFAQRGVPA
jgi:hypothetical protein